MNKGATFWRRRLRADKTAAAALVLLLLLVFAALFAPYLSPTNPHDQLQFDIMDSEMPPVWLAGGDGRFIIGTDTQGRDLLSAILYGLRISVFIGVFAVLLQAALGICIGLAAGYIGGRLDAALMRAADIQLSFSTMMVAIIALALFQALFGAQRYESLALYLLVFIIGAAEWPQYARTAIHYHQAIGHLRCQTQIVCDENQRHLAHTTQLRQQCHYLRLNCYIKRGCRLVRDYHIRLAYQRRGNHYALAHSAG